MVSPFLINLTAYAKKVMLLARASTHKFQLFFHQQKQFTEEPCIYKNNISWQHTTRSFFREKISLKSYYLKKLFFHVMSS